MGENLQQEIVEQITGDKKLLRRINPNGTAEHTTARLKDVATQISYALHGKGIAGGVNGAAVVNGQQMLRTADGMAFVVNQNGVLEAAEPQKLADSVAPLPMQTVHVSPRVIPFTYKDLNFRDSVPIKNDYLPGATEILHPYVDYVGGTGPDAESNNNLNQVEVIYSELRVPVRKESGVYKITTEQMQQMINYGTTVPIFKARVAHRTGEEFFHKNCFLGSALHEIGGLYNHSKVPEIPSEGSWAVSPNNAIKDLSKGMGQTKTSTLQQHPACRVKISPLAWEGLTKEPINSYSPDRALTWIKENLDVFEINKLDWDHDLDTAGTGGKAAMLLYNDGEDCIEYQIVEAPTWEIERITSDGIELKSRRSAAAISWIRPKSAVMVSGILG